MTQIFPKILQVIYKSIYISIQKDIVDLEVFT